MALADDNLKESIRRWTLVLGVFQILVGCIVGFIPPSAVAWFRGIVMAHLEFTANGVLMVAFGFLVRELALGPVGLRLWFALLQIGTWTNGGAGVVAAFVGASSPLDADDQRKISAAGWHREFNRHRLAADLRRDDYRRACCSRCIGLLRSKRTGKPGG